MRTLLIAFLRHLKRLAVLTNGDDCSFAPNKIDKRKEHIEQRIQR